MRPNFTTPLLPVPLDDHLLKSIFEVNVRVIALWWLQQSKHRLAEINHKRLWDKWFLDCVFSCILVVLLHLLTATIFLGYIYFQICMLTRYP